MDFDKFAYRRKESAFPQLSQADEQTVRTVYDYKVLTSTLAILMQTYIPWEWNESTNDQENQSDTDKKRKRYIDGSDDDGGEVLKRSRQSTCKDTEHTRQTKYILPITSKSRDSLNVLQENCGSKEYENQILSLDDKRKGETDDEEYDKIDKDAEVICILDNEDDDSNCLITVATDGKQQKNSSKQDDVEIISVSDDSDALVSETIDNDVAAESDNDDDKFSEEEMVMILSFFNDCSLQELTSVPGLSAKKAERIIKLRPFKSWNDLVSKLDSAKSLSSQLIDKCQSLFEERKVVENLMSKCEKIANTIQQKLNSRLTANESGGCHQESRDVIRCQPSLLNDSFHLKPYQLMSLNWLVLMHEQKVNGILADEMGLGKTVQAIAFLAHLTESGEEGPHLIVVPASTLDNWALEFKRWCSSLQCLLYYGSQAERLHLRNKILYYGDDEPDIIITTYSVATGSYEDRSFLRKLDCHYVILDEGHMLKNMHSQRYHCLMKMKARRRLLLTGTPLQNNLLELMSLLSFVMPQMFGDSVQGIKLLFSNCRTNDQPGSNYEKVTLAQAKRIMKPFVLRRLKKDVLQQLPVKREHVIHCDLTEDQRHLYNEIFLNCSKQFRSSGQDSQYSNILMMLRKAANHPLLLRKHYDDSTLLEMSQEYCKDSAHRDAEPDLVFEDMTVMSDFELHRLCREERRLASYCLSCEMIVKSGKFLYLDSLLPELKQKKRRVLLFSQFTMVMDIIEVYLSDRRHRYLRLDGQTSVVQRQNLIDKYHADHDIFIFLLSTKAGGLGINLTSANVVILHDIDFNPYNDKQAEDRCHRVGQTRDVDVFRLISKDTIDEAIQRCAVTKLQLEHDMAISDKDNEASPKDVLELLNEAFNS